MKNTSNSCLELSFVQTQGLYIPNTFPDKFRNGRIKPNIFY